MPTVTSGYAARIVSSAAPRRSLRRTDSAGTAAASLTTAQVLGWRMARQRLAPIGSLDVPETVRAVCGIQAQVPSFAELGVALRRRDAGCGEAAAAIAERSVLRTWAMRGTLHLLHPAQAPSLLALLAAGRSWERPGWQRAFGISPAELETLTAAVRDALDGRVLDREELIKEIAERSGGSALGEHVRSGWGAVLKPLAWMGHLCNGPSAGGRVTFTRPDTWLADWEGLPDVDAAARIAIPAYLRAHGPATIKTFHAWLAREKSKAAEVRRWFAVAADLLVTVTVDGEPCLALATDLEELRAARPARGVRLIGGFDHYLLGPGTADTRIVAAARRQQVSRAAGWISPVVLDAGRVAGVWNLDDDRLTVTLFAEGRKIAKSVMRTETDRVGAALGRELQLSVAYG